MTVQPQREPFALNTEYLLDDFLCRRERPEKGVLIKYVPSPMFPTEYYVVSHFKGVQDPYSNNSLLSIFGLKLPEDFLALVRTGENFIGKHLITDLSDHEVENSEQSTKGKLAVLSKNYFQTLNYFQTVVNVNEAISLVMLPRCVSLVLGYMGLEHVLLDQ
jgi:hypothetical protein